MGRTIHAPVRPRRQETAARCPSCSTRVWAINDYRCTRCDRASRQDIAAVRADGRRKAIVLALAVIALAGATTAALYLA